MQVRSGSTTDEQAGPVVRRELDSFERQIGYTVAAPLDTDEVEQFVQSAAWVDLLRVFQDQVVTGHGGSLKTVAPLTGFAWRDDDPGGGQSMQWWADAVDPNLPAHERDRHRTRLLRYNEDDVAATRHIRNWLDAYGPALTPAPP